MNCGGIECVCVCVCLRPAHLQLGDILHGLSPNVIIDCKSREKKKPQITGKQHCIKEQRGSMAVH